MRSKYDVATIDDVDDDDQSCWKSKTNFCILCILLLSTVAGFMWVAFDRKHQFITGYSTDNDISAIHEGTEHVLKGAKSLVQKPVFSIQIVYMTNVTEEQRLYFEESKHAWSNMIAEGWKTPVRASKGMVLCGLPPLEQEIIVQDMVIFVSILSIDGHGGILGQAGPCAYDKAGRVRAGLMRFDIDDIGNHFRATVRHEMGHVFGIGSTWDERNLLTPEGVSPVTYTGDNGNRAHRELGGEGDSAIVENEGGAGTARSHWKESSYPNEIMTGFLSKQGVQPISKLSVAALKDLGFKVDITRADEYSIPPTRTRRRLRSTLPSESVVNYDEDIHEKIQLLNDIYKGTATILEED